LELYEVTKIHIACETFAIRIL